MGGTFHAIRPAIRQLEPCSAGLQKSIGLVCALLSGLVLAVENVRAENLAELDREILQIKSEVASLSQDLFDLEESVLYPADTQIAVFLALKDRDGLELDSVELYLNGNPVSSHLYTDRERESLRKGGVQRLYIGNLPHGGHQLEAVLTARSANERFVRREVRHQFRKRPGETCIQMTLDAAAPDYEPTVSFQEWK